MRRYKSDALIIGGGIAGIVTALELLDADLTVTLLDRDSADRLGGLARESFGGVLLVDTPEQRRAHISDSPDRALCDWLGFGGFASDPDTPEWQAQTWPRRWAETYVQSCRDQVGGWLRSNGVRFLPLPLWVERGLHGEGNSVPRWHVAWGTGQGLTERLIDRLLGHRNRNLLTLAFHHKVTGLISGNGRVTGAEGLIEGGGGGDDKIPFMAEASDIVVATGGINGALDRVRSNWPQNLGRAPRWLLNGSHRYADGLLHDQVAEQGGRVTCLDQQWNYAAGVRHWAPRKPLHGLSLVPPRTALWLDPGGRRIGPDPLVSGYDTSDLVRRVCDTGQGWSWMVLNRKIALRELTVSGAEFNPSIRSGKSWRLLRDLLFGNRWLYDQLTGNCPDFLLAHDLEGLVIKMNALMTEQGWVGDDHTLSIDAAHLRDTITGYDAEMARPAGQRRDPQLQRIADLRRWRGDRLRICASQRILDPAAGPLIAIRAQVISRKSLGGIQTDLAGHVLDHDGKAIMGLRAVGEAAGFGGGGMHGIRALEGTFLGGCILTARLAAASIASR